MCLAINPKIAVAEEGLSTIFRKVGGKRAKSSRIFRFTKEANASQRSNSFGLTNDM